LLTLALAAFAIVAIRSLREPVLRAAGLALVVNNEPVAPADIIVLTIDSGGAGALEAADLVQSGVSKRVAVFEDPPSREGSEFIRRGFPYEDQAARQIRPGQCRSLTKGTKTPFWSMKFDTSRISSLSQSFPPFWSGKALANAVQECLALGLRDRMTDDEPRTRSPLLRLLRTPNGQNLTSPDATRIFGRNAQISVIRQRRVEWVKSIRSGRLSIAV
jgi:hypothetical protein